MAGRGPSVVNLGSAAAAIDFAKGSVPGSDEADLFDQAAFFLRGIAQDHPFTDGNKRTGLAVTWVFLLASGFHVVANSKEAETFMLDVAQAKTGRVEMAAWLQANATTVK